MKFFLTIFLFLFNSFTLANNIYSDLTGGKCTTLSCFNKHTIQELSGGKCTTMSCYNKQTIRELSGGKCTTMSCYNKQTIQELSGGKCTTMSCYNKQTVQELSGGKCKTIQCYCSLYPCPVGRSYDYNVSGYGNGEYVNGNIDASKGSGDVDGYLTLDDGTEVSFEGEWVGNGEIEGYDENGNYYELEVD